MRLIYHECGQWAALLRDRARGITRLVGGKHPRAHADLARAMVVEDVDDCVELPIDVEDSA